MPSSSSPVSHRRRPLRKRQPLSRSNSSFLGTIKNLVTAPLAWFSSTDDFEDSKDLKGKRRRLAGAPVEPNFDEDDRSSRNKRMRVQSPPPEELPSQAPSHRGYLDPPGSLFHHQQNRPSSPYIQPPALRSASATQSYDLSNNNANFIRANTLSRTMSIDPPARPVSNTSTLPSLNRDAPMDSNNLIRNAPRDMSMPPLSTRPSFRMRTSMTPQPPPREVSEPPPLNTLVGNPTFVRAPLTRVSQPTQGALSVPSATLGSLADAARAARSPVRQHSSLLFGSNIGGEHASHSPRPENAIEKALHELDIYKTPLVPTRLRSSQNPSTSSSDLFRSRRASQLVLMDDKDRNRLGRGGKKDKLNQTKPYAGEGGMKKLLARRKQEVEKDDDDEVDVTQHDEDRMDDGVQKIEKAERCVEAPPEIPPPLPPTLKTDWMSSNASSAAATSSLRVGRAKARNHIVRPVRPAKTKFSAAYDEDEAMEDDELESEAILRKQEREALEEAAKRAPVFQIPEGFSFAKEAKPVEVDVTNAKEPPILSLPFSFTKPTSTPLNPPPQQSQSMSTVPSIFGTNPQAGSASVAISIPSLPPPVPQQPPSPKPEPVVASSAASEARGIPNFFAGSAVLAKPLELPLSAPLMFTPKDVGSTTLNVSSVITPVKDRENPLWEGESKDTQTQTNSSTLFGAFGETSSTSVAVTTPKNSIFGTSSAPSTLALPTVSIFGAGTKSPEAPPPAESSLFGGVSTMPAFLTKPAEPTSTIFNGPVPQTSSLFGNSSSTTSTSLFSAPKPSSLFGEPPKSIAPGPGSMFGSSNPKPSASFSEPQKTSASPAPFTFGQSTTPSTSETIQPSLGTFTTPVEAPKPLFGGVGGGFSFGAQTAVKQAEPKAVSTPFAFGAAPSTPPPADVKKSPAFSFGTASTSASAGFSFSGGGSAASDVSNKPFAFGQPTTPMRRTTPPKSQDQEINMDESPTRDFQELNRPTDRPPLGGGGFAFTSSNPTPTFGGQSNGSAPFTFGASSSHTNPFFKDNQPPESKPFGGGFGQATPSTAFNFGQSKPAEDSPQPNTATTFPFGTTPAPPTGQLPVFAFGGPGNTSTGSAFGQSQTSGSAPGSPSTFNQPSPFAFGAPLPPVNTGFGFGSQPASPAGGNNLSLPQPTTPGGFSGSGAFAQHASSPFSAPTTPSTATNGGALFTIGAAPTPAPAAAGPRQIRKLPNRRGVAPKR
ncbi:hypothetical protein H0H81_008337 [Sphagnurus paluster]|uniref:Uncharacterized protein n=1 Tax=Sphagnurus paluster TaxID=117069 RepID=A0A9P7KKA3_9AGAR|nr:hypothetical protein H0H81_008337 [Sphagnurus paluster]